MLLLLFLFPLVVGEVDVKVTSNYVIKIERSALKSVVPRGRSSEVLNLSGLGLKILEADVFDNATALKSLDLGCNSLSFIPEGIFSKLVNLEHLSLANNSITRLERPFEGLGNLKTLNISNNPLRSLEGTDLFGLSKSSVIFTKGLALRSIKAHVFDEEPGALYAYAPRRNHEEETSDDYLIKVCINDEVLTLVELFQENETLPGACTRSKINHFSNILSLENLGIAKFEKGWYQLAKPIVSIILAGNRIVEVTGDLLNDLPPSVLYVYLSDNRIERLTSGTITNGHIRSLRLDSNRIAEIEPNALANVPNLRDLVLNKNLMNSTKFATTLPTSLRMLQLKQNRITDISGGSLSGLVELNYLHLDSNLIEEIGTNELHGLVRLNEIGLANNRLSIIEPETFQQTNLHVINLSNNSIAGFSKGTFDNLRVSRLDLGHNKLSNLKDNFPDGLPVDLEVLVLDFNEIKELEREHFQLIRSLYHLSVKGNKISKVKPGTFDSGTLFTIALDKNLLKNVDVEAFRGLGNVVTLSLGENCVSDVPKGFLKHMGNLCELDLSRNPIKRLRNGALHGLRKSSYSEVVLNEVPLEVIEGGVFDDA